MKIYLKISLIFFLFSLLFSNNLAFSQNLKKIIVIGNERVSNQTIEMFASVNLNDELNDEKLNLILKNLYESGFFEDVKVSFNDSILEIFVKENPIISNINYDGIESSSLKQNVLEGTKLKEKSSYNKILINKDIEVMKSNLKSFGYFFSDIEVLTENLKNNQISINYKINIGKKAKIKKIKFLGNKVFKDSKLKNIIVSEEYKFWKFLSQKKYLNENIIDLDMRLLKNFFLNEGYYNVDISNTFARLLNNEEEFELIYNINANEKIYFGNLKIDLPNDFNEINFYKLNQYLNELNGTKYSINKIQKILNEIDKIVLNEQYQSTKSTVKEELISNKLNLEFSIIETEKILIKKINIFGNNVTAENVIRNQLLVDEGDYFNDILNNKSINNIKSLNFFKEVSSEIIDLSTEKAKIININVKEKPTGEIMAGAGFGTSGSSLVFGVKENNFLGRGVVLDSNLNLATDYIKGEFSITNPNYNNSDKSLRFDLIASELDRFETAGYKSSKTGTLIGTNFEYFDDLYLGLGTSAFFENVEADSTASDQQKKQAGNYFDTFLKIDVDYDKRNQKFQTSDGFRSSYSVELPVVSDNYSLINSYTYKYFTQLYDNNISTFAFTLKTANSLNNENVKLSERLYVPSKLLRGFETGKIGPKDGKDYIGGNFLTSLNFSSSLPKILENNQNTDLILFFDAANLWGVDYDSSLDNNKIRTTIGIGLDWFTPVGPLNFSLAQPITKSSTDVTETFRFNLGTTF